MKGEHYEKLPTGIFDKNILCQSCESTYMKWDGCVKKFLDDPLKDQQAYYHYQGAEIVCYELFNVNYKQLKLFILSSLWRWHVASYKSFNRIDLGPYFDKIRKQILEQNAGDDSEFEINLSKFIYKNGNIHFHIIPFRKKVEGINYYVFHVYGYTFYIKVDKQIKNDVMREIRLKENGYLALIMRDFDKSIEKQALINMIRNNRQS